MSGLISTMIIFVTLMVLSYVLVRTGVLSRNFAKDSSQLVLNVLLCATIINSVLNAPALSNSELMYAMLLITLEFVLFYLLASLLSRFIAPDGSYIGVVMLLMAVNNNMFIGLPVAEQVFGQSAGFYITIGCLPFNAILYTYGIWSLKRGDKNGELRVKDMLCPPLFATIAAIAIFMLRIELPGVLIRLISYLSNATLPISMFVIGAALSSVNLLESFKNPRFYVISAVRLLLMPLVTWFVFRFLTSDTMLLGSLIVSAACPSGIVVTALSLQYDKDGVFPSECILLDTLLSMLTIPLVLKLLF